MNEVAQTEEGVLGQPIDADRCLRAMEHLSIGGYIEEKHHHGRLVLIEKAIRAIQTDPGAFAQEYIGMKNYAGFGDQTVECRYGYGPKHGSVVFRIGRVNHRSSENPAPLGDDHIYLLECFRDFGVVEVEEVIHGSKRPVKRGLCEILRRLSAARKEMETVGALLRGRYVEQVATDG